MPAIESSTSDGLDFARHTVSNTNWDTFTFPNPNDEVVFIRSSAEFYVSRTATGALGSTGAGYQTVPVGGKYKLVRRSSRNPLSLIQIIQLTHSSATGVFEFELSALGRDQ
ncbi:MAG: hypothetical protein AAGA48_41220 [Myxococcota bacterium]